MYHRELFTLYTYFQNIYSSVELLHYCLRKGLGCLYLCTNYENVNILSTFLMYHYMPNVCNFKIPVMTVQDIKHHQTYWCLPICTVLPSTMPPYLSYTILIEQTYQQQHKFIHFHKKSEIPNEVCSSLADIDLTWHRQPETTRPGDEETCSVCLCW